MHLPGVPKIRCRLVVIVGIMWWVKVSKVGGLVNVALEIVVEQAGIEKWHSNGRHK